MHLQKTGRKQLLRMTSRVSALKMMMGDERGRTSLSDLSYRGRESARAGRTSYCRSSSFKPALSRAASLGNSLLAHSMKDWMAFKSSSSGVLRPPERWRS